jgi:hypothetical protein
MGGHKESRKRPRSDADAARHDWLTSGRDPTAWQFEDAPDLSLQWRRRKQVVAPPAAPAAPADGEDADAPSPPAAPAAPADGEDAPSPPAAPLASRAVAARPAGRAGRVSGGAERRPGCTECSFVETLIADAELGRFDLVRVAVEDAEGGCYRGVLPMAGTFTEGRALPVKSARAPIKTLRAALLPGWYVLYGKHPAALRGVDPEDEADVGGLAACKWTSASGNQTRDVKLVGVEKRYFDAAASLVRGGFRARGAVFARVEDEAARLWCGGGPIVMILVVKHSVDQRLRKHDAPEPSDGGGLDAPAATRTRVAELPGAA